MVLAHTFGERYELPIPLALFVAAGAATVLVSFVLVLRARTAGHAPLEAADVVPARRQRPAAGLALVVLLLAVATVGLTGTQEVTTNLAPLLFWLVAWIVVPLTCGLIGDWTKPVNPFAALARFGDDPGLRKAVLARKAPLEWTFGWWPAVGLYVLLVLGELVFNLDATKPASVGAVLLVYSVTCFVSGLLFGPSFAERGEVFSGLYDTWGRLGARRFGAPGREGFTGGLDVPFEVSWSRTVFVLLLLVSVNFDGLLATPQWQSYERSTIGLDAPGLRAFRVASLFALIAAGLLLFGLFARASARAGRHGTGFLPSLTGLLPSLVPIAWGYLFAHSLQYVLTDGQLLLPVAVNPGYDSLPRPGWAVDFDPSTTLLPNSFYWYVSVLVIVAVHVLAVVLAHRVLASRAPDEATARRSEYPWLVAMVAYTALSLFLIAQPLTQGG